MVGGVESCDQLHLILQAGSFIWQSHITIELELKYLQ